MLNKPDKNKDGTERLDWAVGFLSISFQFVYRVLGAMTRILHPGLGTMGVMVRSGNTTLRYDSDFILELEDPELVYVLYHEVLHIVLHHCTCRQFDNHVIGNDACDLAVNELVPVIPGSCEPPKKDGKLVGLFVSELKKDPQFKDIESNQTAEYYYEYLMKKAPKIYMSSSSGDGKSKPSDPTLGNGRFDNHSEHKEDEIASERVRAIVNDIQTRNMWGSVSTGVQEMIIAAQHRKINWRNILRQFYGNIASSEREATRKRPNRRTGLIHPGFRHKHYDRHLVAIDTSGSIDSGLLSQFLGVINQVSEEMPIDLMQFDCEKQTDPKPFDRRMKEFGFIGRGGTDFTPVMKVAEERRYKSIVILTDGEAASVPEPAARVVWVLPTGHNPPVDWGLKIHMDKYA